MFKEKCNYIGGKSASKLLTSRWCEAKYRWVIKCPKKCKDEYYSVSEKEIKSYVESEFKDKD